MARCFRITADHPRWRRALPAHAGRGQHAFDQQPRPRRARLPLLPADRCVRDRHTQDRAHQFLADRHTALPQRRQGRASLQLFARRGDARPCAKQANRYWSIPTPSPNPSLIGPFQVRIPLTLERRRRSHTGRRRRFSHRRGRRNRGRISIYARQPGTSAATLTATTSENLPGRVLTGVALEGASHRFTPVALAIPTEMAIEFDISWKADEPGPTSLETDVSEYRRGRHATDREHAPGPVEPGHRRRGRRCCREAGIVQSGQQREGPPWGGPDRRGRGSGPDQAGHHHS